MHARRPPPTRSAPDDPGLLDVDWTAFLPPDPIGTAVGPEVPDLATLHALLSADTRPLVHAPAEGLYPLITARLTADWHPRRIILFGSRARADADERSDIDLLIELDSYTSARRALFGLYASVGRTLPGVDLVVARPDVLARARDVPTSVYARALAEGRLLYSRPAP